MILGHGEVADDPRPGRAEAALRRPDAPRPAARRVARASGLGSAGRHRGARRRRGRPAGSAGPRRASSSSSTGRPASSRRSTPSPTPLGDPGRARGDPVERARASTSASCLPSMARVMDKVTVVRSVTHPYPIHGVAYATTGIPRIDGPDGAQPARPAHWPFIGSVVDYVDRARARARPRDVPRNLAPALGVQQPAGRRGPPRRPVRRVPRPAYDPIATEFVGQGDASGPGRRSRRRPGRTSSRTGGSPPRAGSGSARSPTAARA